MEKVNENDEKILMFCLKIKRSVNEIAKYLGISPASASVRIKNLEEKGKVVVERKGHGKKSYVRNLQGIKVKDHFITLLKEIKRKGGVTIEEYDAILPFSPFKNPDEYDKLRASMTLGYVTPKLIEKKIFITREGEKFLKKHSKKK